MQREIVELEIYAFTDSLTIMINTPVTVELTMWVYIAATLLGQSIITASIFPNSPLLFPQLKQSSRSLHRQLLAVANQKKKKNYPRVHFQLSPVLNSNLTNCFCLLFLFNLLLLFNFYFIVFSSNQERWNRAIKFFPLLFSLWVNHREFIKKRNGIFGIMNFMI